MVVRSGHATDREAYHRIAVERLVRYLTSFCASTLHKTVRLTRQLIGCAGHRYLPGQSVT